MQIHRVVRDLVTSKRNFWLAAKSLRVVEDAAAISKSRSIRSAPSRATSS